MTDAIVLMDREQGGIEMLASQGIKLHPIISMFKLLNVLLAAERIDAQTAQSVRKFILDNNTFRYCPSPPKMASIVRVLMCDFNTHFTCKTRKVTIATCASPLSAPRRRMEMTFLPPRSHVWSRAWS